ncbi:MAG: DUF420 domain-containing protein, partial [Candidatus Omnitrophica bacterium]|nr:DUF420 domain-containing protein [Candidatus Omnitrophota bacterium]
MDIPVFPTLNASLNLLAFIFLVLGAKAIKRKDRILHQKYMAAALISSALFLTSYVTYHLLTHIVTKYHGQGIPRFIY